MRMDSLPATLGRLAESPLYPLNGHPSSMNGHQSSSNSHSSLMNDHQSPLNGHSSSVNGLLNGNTSSIKEPPAAGSLEFGARQPWSDDKEKVLLGPYDYLLAHPGKDIRTQMLKAFNTWLNVPHDSLKIITKVIAMLHTASLLVDDVEDSSNLRRGFPVAHSIFGVAQTINSANYVYFCALAELSKLNNPSVVGVYTEELINLHRGQGMELFWRDTLTTPTEEDYLTMVSDKTGGLFRLAVKLMQAESASDVDYVPLVNLIGLLFQIRDDYMNLESDQYTKNKGFCEDLTEGKFSFPIIHSIRSDPSNRRLLNILRQRSDDEDVKKYAVRYMKEETKSFDYSKNVMRELSKKASAMIEQMGGNAILENILVQMAV